jgi:hypothetical protein
VRAKEPPADEAYQVQLDNWAEALANTASDLIGDPLDAAGVLMQAAMMVSLKAIGVREYAEAQLAAAQKLHAEIMGPSAGTTH